MSSSPNPIDVAWSIWRSLRTVRAPRPTGPGRVDHHELLEPLSDLAHRGPKALVDLADPVRSYVRGLQATDPDRLDRPEALAFWINLYNAGALLLAAEATSRGKDSVLRLPGGFRRPFVSIAGEDLSLDAVEHAKLRRFCDPRVHGALVCGSVSCPTLRGEPYRGDVVDDQLDDQMRRLLSSGALLVDDQRRKVSLSRMFLWYGSDFVRPHRMPTWLPATGRQVLGAVRTWMDPEVETWIDATDPSVEFQEYDWGLACTVG